MVTWDSTVTEQEYVALIIAMNSLHKDMRGYFTSENKEALPEKDELHLHSKYEAVSKKMNYSPNEGESRANSESAAQNQILPRYHSSQDNFSAVEKCFKKIKVNALGKDSKLS